VQKSASKAYFIEKTPQLIIGDHLQTLRYDVAYAADRSIDSRTNTSVSSPPIRTEILKEHPLSNSTLDRDLGHLYDRLHSAAGELVQNLASRLCHYSAVVFVSGGNLGSATVPPSFMACVAGAAALRKEAPNIRIILCGHSVVANADACYDVFDRIFAGDAEAEILAELSRPPTAQAFRSLNRQLQSRRYPHRITGGLKPL